jgi:DNA segregation ATPase FtsK/SpoIIIE, S-DNA-T family
MMIAYELLDPFQRLDRTNPNHFKRIPLTDIVNPHRRFAPLALMRQMIRYLCQSAGLLMIAGGVLMATALLSYSPADPARNFATGSLVHNLMGQAGANLADNLYRTAGYAAAFPVLMLLAWGWRLLTDQRLPVWQFRLLASPLAWLGFTVALTALAGTGPWDLQEGAGGWTGAVLLPKFTMVLGAFGIPDAATGTGILVAALLTSLFVLALDFAELRLAARILVRTGVWIARRAASALPLPAFTLPHFSLPRLRIPQMQRDAVEVTSANKVHVQGPGWASPTSSARRRSMPDQRESAEPDLEPEVAEAPPVIDVRVGAAPKPSRRLENMEPPLPLGDAGSFSLPPVSLLQEPIKVSDGSVDADLLTENARALEAVLEDFGVRGEIMTVRPGPVVTLYELQPAPGTKASRVVGLADDIARNMAAVSVRIATIRGKNAIGIELPNKQREVVYLRELLSTQAYDKAQSGLPLVLGKDIGGQPVVVNLERMPHLLIAGTTGSGKSVAINTMILSLLYSLTPEKCRFIMVDPKMLELSVYDDIPHLLTPVVTDPRKAVVALKWAVREMENRYRAMSTLGVRNIRGYNEKIAEALKRGKPIHRRVQTGFDPETGAPVIEEQQLDMNPLPYIVVIVDEMADLMLVAGKDIEAAIQRLAQMARAAGIHLIMATQRPSVDVITGTIKANFPTRISFQVTSKIDSRTILGEGGAEQLLGQGDMLYMAGGGRIQRAHGPFVTDEEVAGVTEYLRSMGEPDYVDSVTEDDDIAAGIPGFGGESGDDLYDQAVNIVLRERKASTSFLQRHLKIGYNRAASLIDRMEAERVISQANHVGKREVLVPTGGDHF